MRTLIYAGILALAIAPVGSSFAQNDVGFDVLGNIKGTLDGKPKEWLTVRGEVDGEDVASASWQLNSEAIADFSASLGSMADMISPEQRAQLEAMGGDGGPMAEMMAQLAGGANPMADMMAQMANGGNPMAEMMAQMSGMVDGVTLTISGLDPDSPKMLQERFLVLEIFLDDPDELVPGVSYAAEVHYFPEASDSFIPKMLYVSDYDDNDGAVTFDQLDLQPGGGHASGRFNASICRLDMKRVMDGPDLSDCMQVEGTFDTRLVEETSS